MGQGGNDFNAIRISLASPEQIRLWSYGTVTKPETINYRTLRPEKDGLFCERIFGPTKDWECYCGKYKKMRHRGIICDRCGVEIARAKVRRERMGHIDLAAPVAHIWFSKGTPSRLGLMLDLSPKNLDRVLYFAQYLITAVDTDMAMDEVDRLQGALDVELERLEEEYYEQIESLQARLASADEDGLTDKQKAELSEELRMLNEKYDEGQSVLQGALDVELERLEEEYDEQIESLRARLDSADEDGLTDKQKAELREEILIQNEKYDEGQSVLQEDAAERIDDIEGLRVGGLLTESRYRDLRDSCGNVFEAGMGAEAVLELLRGIDLDEMRDELQQEIRTTSGQRHKKAVKRLRVVEAFRKSENKPEWMIFTSLPVLPPELRPMVQLDGGRFATSDLNDLYRRVINRNNRLRRLIDLMAPEIIVRNEKRMLQEAVDALVDNGRRGRAVAGSHNHKLKSLSDLLRGKQGRFRQNLLGKRVDYSGRSVIIVGPELQLDECGLPRKMALELFKPFVMNRLVLNGYAHNIKSAKRLAESERPEVWDILEQVVKDRPVLLNRAPTLHRLGIQAFQPVLIEGSAIRLHPLVTTAFNADFDGDQMAVHVPLSKEAVWEAKRMMLSTHNMLAPSSGEPIVSPTLDMVLGCFYMTQALKGARGEGREFADTDDARLAYDLGLLDLRALVKARRPDAEGDDVWEETTPGRIIFNDALPAEIGFQNKVIDRGMLNDITSQSHDLLGSEGTAEVLDNIKEMGFHYASKSGITIAINDVEVPTEKNEIIGDAEGKISRLEEMYDDGLVTEDDRYEQTIQVWTDANDNLTSAVERNLNTYGGSKQKSINNAGIGLYMMATSGAKGNIAQIKQMAGMRGLMSDPHGRIIERPIKSSFREGLSVLEYFLSTHGARKGLTDTALRTADSGYMTRRLIDVAQELIILEEDCGTMEGLLIEVNREGDSNMPPFSARAKSRYAAEPVADMSTGEIIVERNAELSDEIIAKIEEAGVPQVMVRSPIRCEAERGLCRMCYGMSLATWDKIMIGEAVGIIAAQSIGEPGTQLTMRTFHTGGIAGSDITSGLPRVNELFEARVPKGQAVLSEIDGTVEAVGDTTEGRIVQVVNTETYTDEYLLPEGSSLRVWDGDLVKIGDTLAVMESDDEGLDDSALAPNDVLARVSGVVRVEEDTLAISWTDEDRREYQIPAAANLIVNSGDVVSAGDSLTSGPKSPQRILSLQGREAVQQYLIDEVQAVYRSQGVTIHDKHIEVIISQMLRKVEVVDAGDTNLLPGDQVDRRQFDEHNAAVLAEGGEPATASPVLLGITRASLKMDSFLSAASFQETTRVLTEAAVNGEVDYLRGLKENVIIGRLIPARLDLTEEGRKFLDIPEDEVEIDPISMLVGPDGGEYGDDISREPFGVVDDIVEEQAPVGDD